MSLAPAAAAFSTSSTPRSSVLSRCSVTGGCWMTATLCELTRLGMAQRVVAGPRQHSRQLLAELRAQPARGIDERVEVDARLHAETSEQIGQVLGRDVAGRVGRKRAAAGAADRRVKRDHALLQGGGGVRVAGVARVVEVGADGGAERIRA